MQETEKNGYFVAKHNMFICFLSIIKSLIHVWSNFGIYNDPKIMRWKVNLKYDYKSCKSRLLSKALSKLTKGINALRREMLGNLHFYHAHAWKGNAANILQWSDERFSIWTISLAIIYLYYLATLRLHLL